ncbi:MULTISPECIES: nuclear transport factor 2 family protein [unclassified Sulfitobacter]|uniref:nuclear transport factor 2 family protein n=1 Tax=unclassified Sulfitobacter TaxID=196795 RepID=UPI0023E09619|nr:MULTISPECIES: nuclear transport factor 2 family protein [unclassified Sulfitobacter]
MSTAENLNTVTAFLERFSAGNIDGVLALLDDAAIWRDMGRDGELPISGEMTKEDIVGLMSVVGEAFPQGRAWHSLRPTGHVKANGWLLKLSPAASKPMV